MRLGLGLGIIRGKGVVGPDITAPTISSTSPADNATGVADTVSPSITFTEPVAFGTGLITLRENNGGWADLETFDVVTEVGVGNGQVSISGAVLTINPTATLTAGREYAIRIAATAIDDLAGNSFAGVADDTTISFTVSAGGTAFTRANVITAASTAGRTSVATLKIPGVDTLPAGASFSAGLVTVSGNDVVLEDWKINRITGSGLRCIIRQCEIEDTGTGGAAYPVDPSGTDWLMEDCDLYGQGDPAGSSALVVGGGDGFIMRRCYLANYANDGVKINGTNFLFERNLVGPADNTAGVVAYNAGTYYPPGSFVSFSGTFEKISTAPAGTTPVDGADWNERAPHVDQMTINAGSGIIRYNHFPFQPVVSGLTQRIRLVRDTGTNFDIGPIQVYGNVFDDWNGAYPLSSGVIRSWQSGITYSTGEYAANGAGTVYYRATATTTDDPDVDLTDWTPDRDLNADGDHLWAYNFIEPGTSGLWNGGRAPVSLRENRDDMGNDLGFFGSDVMPAITAPTNVGDTLSYTSPTRYGPAQVFTITPTTYNGKAQVGGVTYNNVCVIRVGIQFAGMIDSSGFWYVNPLMGVTITPLGGGDYKLRIYDPAGNPMSGSVSIPVGAATVTPNANESTTGPAWGSAPAIVLTNNVPFAYNHTVIQTVGQDVKQETSLITPHSQNLSNLPLLQNDFTIGIFTCQSSTDRNVAISSAGYTSSNDVFINDINDLNIAIGYKQQGASPDTTFDTTASGNLSGMTMEKIVRAYRGAASVSYTTAQGTNGNTVNPPSVTATKANSLVVVVGVTSRFETPPGMTAGYGVNTDVVEGAQNWAATILITEVEVGVGTYDPAAMTFGGTGSVDNCWFAATFLITPP